MRVTQIGLISFIVFVVLNIMKQHGAKYDIQTLGQNCGIYNCKIVRRNSNANANGGGPFMSGWGRGTVYRLWCRANPIQRHQ